MNFQHMEAYRHAGEEALTAYGLADEYGLSLLHRSENVTFLVSHRETKEKYAVMRVSRPGYHTLEETRAEVRWLDRIVGEGTVKIAVPVRGRDQEPVICVHVDGQTYHCLLCEYLEGEAPDPDDGDRGFWWFRKTGEAAARLHLQVMSWEEGRRLCRPVWDYEALLGKQGLFGDWRLCGELQSGGRDMIAAVCGQIRKQLMQYGAREENFGLIHSDLRAANLLVKDGEIRVLDFDDCGYGWFLFDLAASLSFIEDDPRAAAWMEAWLEGYTAVRRLEEPDYHMIPTFLMARRIQLLAWITSHDDSDPVKAYRESLHHMHSAEYKGFADSTVRMARRYLGNHKEN